MPTSPLTPPVFHILLALSDEDRHGYGIMQDVALQTGGALQMGPGTLYGCLKRMLDSGLIAEAGDRPDPALGPGSGEDRRRYYSLTPLGRQAVHAEAQRLADALEAAKSRRVFAGESYDRRILVVGDGLPDLRSATLRLSPGIPHTFRRGDAAGLSGSIADRAGQSASGATHAFRVRHRQGLDSQFR